MAGEIEQQIVKAGYRQLAKKLHPDRGGTAAQMVALNAARDHLLHLAGNSGSSLSPEVPTYRNQGATTAVSQAEAPFFHSGNTTFASLIHAAVDLLDIPDTNRARRVEDLLADVALRLFQFKPKRGKARRRRY